MIQKIILIYLISVCVLSCNSHNQTINNLQEIRLERIKKVIQESGFVKLPLSFDAYLVNSLKTNYNVDSKGQDSLIFDSDIYEIIGFLPDTTKYYAFLFSTVGDMLYPTILTIDKKGNKIDRQIICATGCEGHVAVAITSCYDSVWISQDLTFKSISKIVGTVDTEDSIPQTLNICNIQLKEGFIEPNGQIILNESELLPCAE